MAKKITYGTVDFGPEELKDENITAMISLKMPMKMLKDLRRLALTERHRGRYQTLIKDILSDYIEKNSNAWDGTKSEVVTPKKRKTLK